MVYLWSSPYHFVEILYFWLSDDEFGQKKVSVMLDGRETELEIIDHPSSEISVRVNIF